MIRVEGLTRSFGGSPVLRSVSLSVAAGSITGLVGANGAGKTTLFNVIAGLHRPDSGRVFSDNTDITGLPPHVLFQKGVLRTFQIAHEFSTLSVLHNLMMVPQHPGESMLQAIIQPESVRQHEQEIADKAHSVLQFLNIDHLTHELAGNLSGGQKKLLELGRTMMVEPKIVFLDEVGAGVNRSLLNTIGDAILRLNQERGYTFCMIEHDMAFISRMCSTVLVMANGQLLTEGTPAEVMQDEQVIESYLGSGRKRA